MGLSDRFRGLMTNVQEGAKSGSTSLMAILLRLVIGFFLGFTAGLVGQQLSGYGTVSLTLVTVVIMGIFLRISAPWRLSVILVFGLICILVAQLLRMYILLAP